MKTMTGSIFGKRLKVVKEDESDYMNNIVVCPYCGEKTLYGETMMISGIVNCPKCHDRCVKSVMFDRENNYENYLKHDYQPYGVERKKI